MGGCINKRLRYTMIEAGRITFCTKLWMLPCPEEDLRPFHLPTHTCLNHTYPCPLYHLWHHQILKKTLELNLPIATRLSGTLLQTDNSDSLLSKNHHQPTVLLFNYAKERIKQTNLGWKINLMAWIWKLCDKIFLYGKTTNYWQNKSSTFVLYLVELI